MFRGLSCLRARAPKDFDAPLIRPSSRPHPPHDRSSFIHDSSHSTNATKVKSSMSRFLRRAPNATPVAPPADKGPVSHTPILTPTTAPTSAAPTAPLSGEQQRVLTALRAYGEELHAQGWTDAAAERETYEVWERHWLDDERTTVRYARAAKWDLENAKKRLSVSCSAREREERG